jgi:hypothetical protein
MNSAPSLGPIGMPELIVFSIFMLIPLIVALTALISCLKSNFQDSTHKLIWVLVILFLPLLGSILYFIISPKQRLQ